MANASPGNSFYDEIWETREDFAGCIGSLLKLRRLIWLSLFCASISHYPLLKFFLEILSCIGKHDSPPNKYDEQHNDDISNIPKVQGVTFSAFTPTLLW